MLVTPFLAEPIYSLFQPVFERDGRIPAEFPLGLCRRDFLAPKAAGARRHELNLHMVPDRLADPFCHFQDRDLSRTFEVVCLIGGGLFHSQDVASAMSRTYTKFRYCSPFPDTVRGSPLSAFFMKTGISSSSRMRGPYGMPYRRMVKGTL